MDFAKILKVVAFRFNGVDPIEPNPRFVEEVSISYAYECMHV